MLASVVAAVLAARPGEDGLRRLRRQKYDDASLAAVDVASSRPPMDAEVFRVKAGNDTRMMLLILSDFLGAVPDLTRRIRIALDLGDGKELARCAAALKEKARVFGADAFIRSVEQLEAAAQIDITLAWRAADVFDRDLARLVTSLEHLRRDLSPPSAE